MTDSERMMHRVVHDLRTPIGVAQGYLRLIRDGSLKTDADRDRALDQAAAALGQLARMCQEISGYLDEESATRQPASAAAFAGRVEAVAIEHGFSVVQDGVTTDAVIDLPSGMTASAGAVIRVFESALRRRSSGSATTLRVIAQGDELRFVAGAEGGAESNTVPARVFDPWREPGLDVALACQRIARASGEIRPVDEAPGALTIAFPVRRISL